jgi:hypothetical protein
VLPRICGPQSSPLRPSRLRAVWRGWTVRWGIDAAEVVARDEAPEVPKKLGLLAVPHLLDCKELADMLLCRGGQLSQQFGLQRGVGLSFRWRGDDVFYFRAVLVVQLRDHVAEIGPLATDAGQDKLCLSLGEPHSWPHGHSGYLRSWCVVHSLRSSSGSRMWDVGCRFRYLERQPQFLMKLRLHRACLR